MKEIKGNNCKGRLLWKIEVYKMKGKELWRVILKGGNSNELIFCKKERNPLKWNKNQEWNVKNKGK